MPDLPELFDWLAVTLFLACWVGYTRYAKRAALYRDSLSSVMHEFRVDWMRRILRRHNRVADMSAVSNLERNSAFFASSSLFAVAGLVTVLAASERVVDLASDIALLQPGPPILLELKIGLMIAIFIYAFLSFTWSMRQYGFASVLIGAAPMPDETLDEDQTDHFSNHSARVLDLAARQFNYGLRAAYFSLAAMGWLLGPVGLIIFSVIISLVLYHREFRSSTLRQLVKARG